MSRCGAGLVALSALEEGVITIALWADFRALGICCAKGEYGADMIDDVLRGYSYHDRHGRLIVRLTKGEISEDDRCEKCENPLFLCNACEVTV